MDRYVIRDEDNAEFVSVISHKGVETSHDLTKAIIINNLDQAEQLLKYLDEEDYVVEEIEFRVVDLEKE